MKNKWFLIDDTDALDSPALTLHADRIQYNIDVMIAMAKDPARLRPHVKTYKMPEIVKMQMESGIRKFKCATIAEAEMLGLAGAPDVLIAFPLTGPKLDRFFRLIAVYPGTRFSAIIDHETGARALSEKAVTNFAEVGVYLDINNGNDRTGLPAGNGFQLFKQSLELKGINPLGLHVYDGHIRNTDPDERKIQVDHDFEKVKLLAGDIRQKLDVEPVIIAGGSPTFPVHAQDPAVECSPGTSLLWDAGYAEKFPDIPFQTAAVVVSRVISRPGKDLLCTDLGHKSIAAENPLENRVRFLNVEGLEPVSHSEEHLVLRNTQNNPVAVGDVLYGIPWHICPTTALYQEVTVIRNNRITGTWEVPARTRKITL
ncbi:MAG: D-TA family PLP-dependent enzyme [Cyclobacteriaceae bacterium]|nr:D-TA family PLP-dependent enzyme [Cyclobacteriaceae bacterium]